MLELTEEQRSLLERAITVRSPKPLTKPLFDEWQSRLEAISS